MWCAWNYDFLIPFFIIHSICIYFSLSQSQWIFFLFSQIINMAIKCWELLPLLHIYKCNKCNGWLDAFHSALSAALWFPMRIYLQPTHQLIFISISFVYVCDLLRGREIYPCNCLLTIILIYRENSGNSNFYSNF